MENLNTYRKYFEVIDERTSFSLIKKYVIQLIDLAEDQQEEIERLTSIIESNKLPLHPCEDCNKEERNPGLSVCGECYHKRIIGNN